ncbi:MAG: endonuclease domain-containing protein [Alphaproteobacteria bacterium]|nr:endonuclease domain-containing protein [Alphaproteobacteria bacterium]MBM3642493.1 endonuclease domain-containing protein [Alphaproteobacteria bacterium]
MRGLRILETRRARALRRDATSAERILWRRVQNRAIGGFKFVRQAPVGPYIADFLCRQRSLIVEIDGETHSSTAEIARDAMRTAFLEANGYRLIRFNNAQLYENIEAVIEAILDALHETEQICANRPAPHLTSPRKRGEGAAGASSLAHRLGQEAATVSPPCGEVATRGGAGGR